MTDLSKAQEKSRADIVEQVKQLVVSSVQLHHIPLEDINESTLLFGDGLGLDSVDILEVVVAVEQKFGVKVKDAKSGQHIFQSIGTIADFITHPQQ